MRLIQGKCIGQSLNRYLLFMIDSAVCYFNITFFLLTLASRNTFLGIIRNKSRAIFILIWLRFSTFSYDKTNGIKNISEAICVC